MRQKTEHFVFEMHWQVACGVLKTLKPEREHEDVVNSIVVFCSGVAKTKLY